MAAAPPPTYGGAYSNPAAGTPVYTQQTYVNPPGVQTVQPTTTVVHTVGSNNPQSMLSRIPCRVTCQFCKTEVTTKIHHDTGLMTWAIAGGMCIIGCIPCCLIPFCMDNTKDVHHTCPQCDQKIGIKGF